MTQATNKAKRQISKTTYLLGFFLLIGAFWGFKAPFASAGVFTSSAVLSQTQNYTNVDSVSPSTYTEPLVVSFCASLNNPSSCVESIYQYFPSSGGFTSLPVPLPAIDKHNASYWQAQGFTWDTSQTYFLEWRTNDSNFTLLSSVAITDYFSPDNLGVQRSHWAIAGTQADNFTVHLHNPDNTSILSGYDYIGNDFGNINGSFYGTNSLGLYDTFYIKVYEDGTDTTTTTTIPITMSCENCDLATFKLSDFGVTYREGHNYLFDITMGGILSQPIKQTFAVSYNISAGVIVYDTCSTGDFFCYIKNGLRWAFTVPPITFDKFGDLKTQIQNKPPFGYITGIYTTLGGFNNSTNGVYTLVPSSDINNMIFTPIKNGLAWVLYIVLAIALFKRFKDINV
jgi:hypothetical protein